MRFCVADMIYPGVKSKRALTNVFVTGASRFREWSQGELRMINILMFFYFLENAENWFKPAMWTT